MFIQRPALWLSRRHAIGVSIVMLVVVVMLGLQRHRQYEETFAGVPIPFLPADVASQADISFYETRNGVDVYAVTFNGNEYSTWLSTDRIYLVHVPNSDQVRAVPLDGVVIALNGMIGGADYYGYRYFTSDAGAEIANRLAPRFVDRFPGPFFASDVALLRSAERDDDPIASFEVSHGIYFQPTDGSFPNVDMRRDTLWIFVVNVFGGARISPLQSPLCGNDVIDTNEDCDDGLDNGTEDSTCNAQCLFKIPIPPLVGGSSSSSGGSNSSNSSSSGNSSSNSSTSSNSSDSSSVGNSSSDSSSSDSSSSDASSSISSSSSLSSSQASTSSSSSSAAPICGNNTQEGTEECDDGDADNSDTCTDTCEFAACGDGYFQPDGADGTPGTLDDEECDDGNTIDNDSCSNSCELIDNPF